MMARIQITFDCADPDQLAQFWADAIGYQLQSPPEGYASWDQWARDNGMEHLVGQVSAIVDPVGAGPRIYFQRVPESKSAKNRVHLDINVPAPEDRSAESRRAVVRSEAERLVSRGAERVREHDQDQEYWIVMRDPEGNEFCLQ